jgi:alkylhydroperoxidase family enzyme
MLAEVERNDLSRLDGRQRAALVLADCFVTDPARLGGDVQRRVLEQLSEREIVELLFDVMAWSQQKVLVALSLDLPVDPEALTSLDFDADGHAVVGGAWKRSV